MSSMARNLQVIKAAEIVNRFSIAFMFIIIDIGQYLTML